MFQENLIEHLVLTAKHIRIYAGDSLADFNIEKIIEGDMKIYLPNFIHIVEFQLWTFSAFILTEEETNTYMVKKEIFITRQILFFTPPSQNGSYMGVIMSEVLFKTPKKDYILWGGAE